MARERAVEGDAPVAARVVTRGSLAGELLEREALRLGDEEGREKPADHEEREDLQEGVQVGAAVFLLGHEWEGYDLGYDGTYLPRRCRQPVTGRSIARGKALAWYDEGGCVGAQIEEELGDDVEGEHGARVEVVISEAQDAEEYCEDEETADLKRLPAYGIDCEDRCPVARE